jgi:hypothetical protein
MKKIAEKFQIITSNDLYLELDSALAATVAVREGDVLYAIPLVHKEYEKLRYNIETDRRLMTLIATPFHHESWQGLLRLSVTIDPQPGSLFRLVQAFNLLQIEIRYIEDVTGTRLSDLDINPLGYSQESSVNDSFFPSAMLVVEVLEEASGALQEADTDLKQFHAILREIIDTQKTRIEELTFIENVLSKKCGRKVSIRWISPMAPLNFLSHLFKQEVASLKLEEVQVGKMPTGPKDSRGLLQTGILPWRRMLWPVDTGVPNSGAISRESVDDSLLVMTSSDSDEKIIAWYFYEYSKNLVIYFELVAPASGLEQLWWEYIYDCVQRANGTVLGSRSSARLRGRWVTLYCTAMFSLPSPLSENYTEKEAETSNNVISGIVDCLRELQGDRSYSQEWTVFQARLSKAIAQSWRKVSQNYKSQLERVIVWDPYSDSVVPRFPGLFAENPFSFTLPLELATYDSLYEGFPESEIGSRRNLDSSSRAEVDKKRTRRRLAKAIIGKLSQSPGENIAIVGAHRTGKTTVLNLVYDLLREGGFSREFQRPAGRVNLIPIRINASTTPPYRFFFSVLEGIAALEKDQAKGIRELLPQLKNLVSSLGKALEDIEIGLAIGGGEIKIKKKLNNIEKSEAMAILRGSRLRNILSQIKNNEGEIRSEFLKLSLAALHTSLLALSKSEGSTTDETRVVVIVDEFSEVSDVEGSSGSGFAGWGNSNVLAVWRHACESREYSSIKWLISTTRSVREAGKYSPLTNIFFEWNVGPLEPDESRRMIDAFSVTAWQNELQDGRRSSRLRPIITFLARDLLIKVTSGLPYLLQVSCYHIYDKATRSEFPVINKALCRKIIITKVLPELADYLEHQWGQIPEEARRFIKDSLPKPTPKNPGDQEDLGHPVDGFLRSIDDWSIDLDRMPPGSLKALNRSGLRGDDQRCVAPLVAAWLLTFI